MTTLLAPPHLGGLMEGRCNTWPLDLDRIGYLQHDLYPGRLFVPALPGFQQAELTPRDGQLEIKADEQVVADLCYWNAGRGGARPMKFGGNCGTALTSRGTSYREGPILPEGRLRSFLSLAESLNLRPDVIVWGWREHCERRGRV